MLTYSQKNGPSNDNSWEFEVSRNSESEQINNSACDSHFLVHFY